MASVLRDLRYGARLLRNAPGFTVVAVLASGLGIGATTAIFSVVDAVLLKPLPFPDSERLLVLWEKNPSLNRFRMFVAPANFREWQQARSFQGTAAMRDGRLNLTGGPNGHVTPEELRVEYASAGIFDLMGAQPILGRTYRAEEDQPGRGNYAVLSHAIWSRRFGADRAIAGKSIRLRDQSYTVLGVLPPGFSILDPDRDVWLPLALNPADARAAAARNLTVIARLKRGVSFEQARDEMESMGSNLERANAALNRGWRPSPFPLREEIVGNIKQPLLVLFAAVGLLLISACANVANLLLARAGVRWREMAIRTALGASRGRLLNQLLAEGILLSFGGGALGIAIAWGSVVLLRRLGPGMVPRLSEARLDARLFLFALGVSAVAGLLFAVIPAVHGSRADLRAVLTQRGGGARSGRLARKALVVAEVGLAVLVLIGSGLLIRSFIRVRAMNPGFTPHGLLTVRLPMAGGRSATGEGRVAFLAQLSERVAGLPGVSAVAAVNALPLTGLGVGASFAVEGRPAPAREQRPIGLMRTVTPDYFRAMGIPLIAGRRFNAADTAQAAPAVIVNQTLARRFFTSQGENPVGQRLVSDANGGRSAEIVGVVGDVKPERMETGDWPTIYNPYPQAAALTMTLVARTTLPPLSLAAAVERETQQLDPDQPVADVRTMEDVVDRAIAGARFNTILLSIFAAAAFLLAAVGIYGVVSYDVTERTNEIGIRMALGAQTGDVLGLVLGEGARLAGCGIVLGLAAALALTRLMASMLYGVNARDVYTFVSIAVLLGVVALLASYIPSRRAMAVDPVTALRQE